MGKTVARRGGQGLFAIVAVLLGVAASACRTDSRVPATAAPSADPEAQQVQIGGVLWYVDYEAALAVAREQDKALWVHFGENPG